MLKRLKYFALGALATFALGVWAQTQIIELTLLDSLLVTGSGGGGSRATNIQNVIPRMGLEETDATANNQVWYIDANGEQFAISAVNDALAVVTDAMRVDRTTTTVDTVTFPGTTVDVQDLTINGTCTGCGAGATFVFKDADETRTSTTTPTADSDLTGLALTTDNAHAFEGEFYISSASATPGIRIDWVFSNAIQAGRYSYVKMEQITTANIMGLTRNVWASTFNDGLIASDIHTYRWRGFIHANATTGGTLEVQWSQQVSNGTPTTIHEGSWMSVTPLGAY